MGETITGTDIFNSFARGSCAFPHNRDQPAIFRELIQQFLWGLFNTAFDDDGIIRRFIGKTILMLALQDNSVINPFAGQVILPHAGKISFAFNVDN